MGRLIDADALMEILTTAIRNMKGMDKFIGVEDDPEIQMEIKAYTDIAEGVKDMPTIEPERKTGKWVGVKEYCDHLNEEAEREGKGNRYIPSGMNIRVYCDECWEPNDRRTMYCPNCGKRMVQEGEEHD